MDNSLDFSAFTRQSPKGIIVLYFQNVFKFLKDWWSIFIPVFLIKNTAEFFEIILILLSVLLIFILIRTILIYLKYTFKIENNHFILKQGVLRKSLTSIAFDKIQNINYKQNFIQQLIGVTQVDIETAGAKTAEISIKALSKEKAEMIKLILMANRSIDQTENTINTDKKTILSLSIADLIKESLTENHLKNLLLLVAFIWSLFGRNKEFLEKIKVENYDFFSKTIIEVSIVFIFVLPTLILFSFVIIILKHYDLTLKFNKNALEIKQGLFTKKHQVLKIEKVQGILISTNPFKQFLGIFSVVLNQVSSDNAKVSPAKIIGCNKQQTIAIKNTIFENLNFSKSKVYKPHNYFIFQLFLKKFFLILIINFFFLFSQNSYLIYLNLVIIPFLMLLIYKNFKKRFFKFNKNVLKVGEGQIATSTIYLEYFKLQNIQLKQTVFQKRKNICNLIIQTASKTIELPCVNIYEAQNIYNYFILKTETSNKPWM